MPQNAEYRALIRASDRMAAALQNVLLGRSNWSGEALNALNQYHDALAHIGRSGP